MVWLCHTEEQVLLNNQMMLDKTILNYKKNIKIPSKKLNIIIIYPKSMILMRIIVKLLKLE